MKPMNANELLAGLALARPVPITAVVTDSRKVQPGCIFVCFPGERVDGHDYAAKAYQAGAEYVIANHPVEGVPEDHLVICESSYLAMIRMASNYRTLFSPLMIGVTGSVGKTTTKEMLAAVLSQHFHTLKTLANFNNFVGTPQTLLRLEKEHQAAVIETGMDHFGEIRRMGTMVRPTIAVITNIGDAHIGNLDGTRQGVLRAKSEIFENLQPGGLAVLNGDDPLLSTLHLPFKTLRCGESENCDVRVTDICERGIEGLNCTVTTGKDSYSLRIPSPGRFMIYSAAMGVAIGEYLGLSKEEIIRGVAAYTPTGSRMRLIHCPGERIIIDDCYNANPQAMAETLRLLAGTRRPRRMAVLGDMFDLGDLAAEAHEQIGLLLNELKLECVVAIGQWMKYLTETAQGNVYHFDTVEQACETLHREFTPGTAVLVKASHAMHFEKIVEELEKA